MPHSATLDLSSKSMSQVTAMYLPVGSRTQMYTYIILQ